MRPLGVDLCSGLGGWANGLEAEGYDVIRVDIEDMFAATGTPKPSNCLLMLQDIRTIHGSQFKHASLIVGSSPCTEFSYMAMPWSRAKQIGRALRGDGDFPEGYSGSRTIEQLLELFNAQFRIQREASEAAGRHIPMVVENVRGAIPWVGRSRWNFGSYHLWGDVPALMPRALKAQKFNPDGTSHGTGSWFAIADSKNRGASEATKVPGFRFDGSGKSFQTASVDGMKNDGGSWFNVGGPGQKVTGKNPVHARAKDGLKHGGDWFSDPSSPSRQGGQVKVKVVAEGRKGAGAGAEWFDGNLCVKSSKSPARKAASAQIAMIPEVLSRHIARVYLP